MSSASCSAVATVAEFAAPLDAASAAAGAAALRDFAVAVLRDDIHVVSALHSLVAAQLELAVGDALAGLDVVLVAVPRADEVGLGVGKVKALRGLVGHDPLFHLGDDQALAGRAALVQAVIAVGVEFAAVLEHTDLGVADEHDAAIAVLELGCLANELLAQECTSLPPNVLVRAVSGRSHGTAAPGVEQFYNTFTAMPPARTEACRAHDWPARRRRPVSALPLLPKKGRRGKGASALNAPVGSPAPAAAPTGPAPPWGPRPSGAAACRGARGAGRNSPAPRP